MELRFSEGKVRGKAKKNLKIVSEKDKEREHQLFALLFSCYLNSDPP